MFVDRLFEGYQLEITNSNVPQTEPMRHKVDNNVLRDVLDWFVDKPCYAHLKTCRRLGSLYRAVQRVVSIKIKNTIFLGALDGRKHDRENYHG